MHRGLLVSFLDRRRDSYLDRIYLGCGFEFLLKAIFLKKSFLINEVNYDLLARRNISKPTNPIKLGAIKKEFLKTKTKNLNYFIQQLSKIPHKNLESKYFNYYILAGLLIAQSWRNLDIHTPTGRRSTNNEFANHLKWSHDFLYKYFLPGVDIPKFNFDL